MSAETPTAIGMQIFMDSENYYIILGDWGTSCGRLYLCLMNQSYEISVIEKQEINGVKFIGNHSQVFEQATQIWVDSYSIECAVLCGTITANIGWVETSYLKVPVQYTDIAARLKCVHFKNLDLYFSTPC